MSLVEFLQATYVYSTKFEDVDVISAFDIHDVDSYDSD